MEVDAIEGQACKFQRIGSNGSTTSDNSSNPQKIPTQKRNFEFQNDYGGGGWPASRIVRVSRASGGKDRHSKVLTSKGPRDRRVRLSVTTAIQFYDLQDRLGYDQPSKAVEWLLKAAAGSIEELPSLDPAFSGAVDEKGSTGNNGEFEDLNHQISHTHQPNNNNLSLSKSSACSSTSETSKGSGGLSLSRSENRIKARERAREMAAKREKEQVNSVSQSSSFTDLLTGGQNPAASPESRTHWTTPMDYFFSRPPPPPQYNNPGAGAGDHHPQQHFSFLQENFVPVTGGEIYNINFSIAGGGIAPGFSRGTLQSNLPSLMHLQRFQPSFAAEGSTSSGNLPFFMAGAPADHYPASGYDDQRGLHLCYGGADGGVRHSDKEKSKN